MPQNALPVNSATKSGSYASERLDTTNNLLTGKGSASALNLAANNQVKVGAGRVCKVNVTVAGAVGAIYDSATIAGIGAANLIAVVPAVVGTYDLDFPFTNGLVYVPGAAQVVSLSYT